MSANILAPLPDGRRFIRQDLRAPLTLAFCAAQLDADGWDASQINQRMAAARAELERRYPVAEGAVTVEEHVAQMAANEKTLRQARRDVTAKILAAIGQ